MKAPPRKTLPLSTLLYLASMGVLTACPSQSETKREPDDGAGSKTGEADATEAAKPSV